MWRISLRIYIYQIVGLLTLPLTLSGFIAMWLGVVLADGVEAGNDLCDKHREFMALRRASMESWINGMYQADVEQAVEKLRKAAANKS